MPELEDYPLIAITAAHSFECSVRIDVAGFDSAFSDYRTVRALSETLIMLQINYT